MSAPARNTTTTPNDWRGLNLADGGRSLIEASAGTGKTWTIAALYLRLLLERGLSLRQIVVTTFTDAAAQELRERLRAKLQWAVALARSDATETVDAAPDAQWLHARWADGDAQRASDFQRLQLAIAEMDVAPIGTLHSLCKRILGDYPFACGTPFTMGEMVDGGELLNEVADDLWRRLQQSDAQDELVLQQQAAEPNLTLGTLKKNLKLCLAPGVIVGADIAAETAHALPVEWAPRLRTIIANDTFFPKRTNKLRDAWHELAEFLDDHARMPSAETLKTLKAATDLTGLVRAGKESLDVQKAARFSEQCAIQIERLREQAILRFWSDLADLARRQIQSRLQSRHQLTFDELLGRVSAALQREKDGGGDRPLTDALFAAWPAALVDEFQDTDGLQYGILDAIYRNADGGKRGRLVMIGDPKQAIYRFRGGDIHAYQRAAAQADAGGSITLSVNHRSSRAMVAAFNEFYAAGGLALSAQDDHAIRYQAVAPSGRRDNEPYTIASLPCEQPLQVHYWPDPPDATGERRTQALEFCARHIADLLQSKKHKIGDKDVQPSDIAVLLPTGKDIAALRDLLRERGVPCTTSSQDSVFDTDAARELQVVLYAVAHHAEPGPLRAAAATRLWGASFSELQQWGDDVASWQPVMGAFRKWHEDWRGRGIQYVVEQVIEHCASRYLATVSGERTLTDLRHLGELLQEQSEDISGAEELLAWFNDCRENGVSGNDAADAAQLRIESDGPRVRLMTLHASKGLEFPIVFLPLMWAHGERLDSDLYITSDKETGLRRVEVSEEAKKREQEDLQDERFRVLYVALTRAIHTCHVYILPPDRMTHKGAKGPGEGTKRTALDVTLARMQPPFRSGELARDTPHIRWIDGWHADVRARYQAADTANEPRHARPLPKPAAGPLPAKHSFTTLTQHTRHGGIDPDASAGDEADGDDASQLNVDSGTDEAHATTQTPSPAHPELQTLAAVRGTEIGNAIHAIFERRVVGASIAGQRELVERSLDDAGVRRKDIAQDEFVDAVIHCIQRALEAPLGAEGDAPLRLVDLPVADLRAEMEFYFSLDRVSMQALRRTCGEHGEADLVPHGARTLSGLMNGKIDLIFHHAGRFHVLDYKGNYLGDSVADYHGDALRKVMDEHHYRFQALLYTVALDRYLRQRMGSAYRRDEHLGECFYLFVRAAGLAPGAGVWRHRFSEELLDAVAAVFAHEETAR